MGKLIITAPFTAIIKSGKAPPRHRRRRFAGDPAPRESTATCVLFGVIHQRLQSHALQVGEDVCIEARPQVMCQANAVVVAVLLAAQLVVSIGSSTARMMSDTLIVAAWRL